LKRTLFTLNAAFFSCVASAAASATLLFFATGATVDF
jgi:hypothetical protein